MTDQNTRYETSDDVVARDVAGEAVLLNLTSGTYFGLNPVGSRIWQLLEEEGATAAQICETLEAEFDVERSQLQADVDALLAELCEHKLLSAA